MKPKFIPSHSRISSEPPSLRPRSIKFIDSGTVKPDAPLPRPGSTPTHPGSPSSVVRRSNTLCIARYPRPTGTFDIDERPRLRRAPPMTQFEMVTPPRSPIPSPSRGSRLPIRTNPTSNVKRRSTIAQGTRQSGPTTSSPAPGVPLIEHSQHHSPSTRSSMIPIRKGLSILGWNESRASFVALNAIPSSRAPGRGALPRAWTGIPSQKSNRYMHDTAPDTPADPMAKTDPHRTRSDPEAKCGGQVYPQLTIKERNVLVRRLRVLLSHSCIESPGLDGWENLVGFQKQKTERPGGVFGVSVIASSMYASCQVVLGEHSHTLPICVFASVEEICRRGMTMSNLFRVASPLNECTPDQLMQSFDRGPSYGANISLASEDISNICALLKLYLHGLPEALLFCSMWPTLQQLTSGSGPSRVAAFQAMLHLQHPVHFSLLVYVLAFLHQLVRHGSGNGLNIPTLAVMFGPALFSPRQDGEPGCIVGPTPDGPGPVLVKTFLNTRDVDEGTRVMSWVLNHWDEIATGLLSLDFVHRSEMDIRAWEASFAPTSEFGSIYGRLFKTPDGGSDYSEGPSIDELVDPALEKLAAFPFPENVTFDHVPVHAVRDSIVGMPELPPRSTHASSPATLWSQETGKHALPPQAIASRAPSLDPVATELDLEPGYVQDLRLRMDAQEAGLASLHQELSMIRRRFVFPLPPSDMPGLKPDTNSEIDKSESRTNELEIQLDTQDWLDEDTMPTPRPPSGSRFATMHALIDSLQSQPVTPLYPRAIGTSPPIEARTRETNAEGEQQTSRDSGYSTPSYRLSQTDILPSAFAGLEPETPLPSHEVSCRVDPDGERESADKDIPTDPKDMGKFEELLTARDALRSALAAMDPVKTQLQAVENELKLRGTSSA